MKKYSFLLVTTAFMLQMGTSLAVEDNQQTAVFSPQLTEEKLLTYTATYVNQNGDSISDAYVFTDVRGKEYSAPRKVILGYELIGVDYANGNPSGILEYDGLSTRFIYAQIEPEKPEKPAPPLEPTEKEFTFTATYVDQAGNSLSKPHIVTGVSGTNYDAPRKVISGYELIGIDYANGNPSGTLTTQDLSTRFIYAKIAEKPEETESTEKPNETEGTESPEESQTPEETGTTEQPQTSESEELPGGTTESQEETTTDTQVDPANNNTGAKDPVKSLLTSVNNDEKTDKNLPQTGEKSTLFVTILGSIMTASAFVVGYRKFK